MSDPVKEHFDMLDVISKDPNAPTWVRDGIKDGSIQAVSHVIPLDDEVQFRAGMIEQFITFAIAQASADQVIEFGIPIVQRFFNHQGWDLDGAGDYLYGMLLEADLIEIEDDV